MILTTLLNSLSILYRSEAEDYWNEKNVYSFRENTNQGDISCGLWFRTEGCSWAKQGSCLMCNYSFGPITSSEQMVSYIRTGLSKIAHNTKHLLISPSGSMLDECEVSLSARKKIFQLLSETDIKSFSFETRAETINEENIKLSQELLNGRLSKVLIGLENINSSYRKVCINKSGNLSQYSKAFSILHNSNVLAIANVLIGLPFLTEQENILASVESIKWALENGADYCFLFPVHVKEGTPIKALFLSDLYKPVSLWSFIEVFNILKDFFPLKRIRPSWYSNFDAYNIIASPYTCDKCYKNVISLLDDYNDKLDNESLDKLLKFECSCKDKWSIDLQKEETYKKSLSERSFNGIKCMNEFHESTITIDYKKLNQTLKGIFNE